jgi:hypothetical protein
MELPDFARVARPGRGRGADLARVLGLLAVGLLLIWGSPFAALAINLPPLSVIGLGLGWGFVAAASSHVMRRVLFPGLDLRQIARLACKDGQAGHVVIGVCLVLAALILSSGQVRAGELPPGAVRHLPVLAAEQRAHWPAADLPTLAAQVEQESCISLRHSKCWTPFAELRTARERGVGLGQITKTANMDNLTALVLRHPRELAGWSWDSPSLYDPALQARGLVLLNRDNWPVTEGAASDVDRWAMVLTAYNGGAGRVRSDRRLCAGTRGCDPSRWWGHAEHTSLLPKQPVSGYGKSFFHINREYSRLILLERRARYVGAV